MQSPWLAVCGLTLSLSAQAGPTLTFSGNSYVLSLDYLEVNLGVTKAAYKINLKSTDLQNFAPDFATLTATSLLSSADPATTAALSGNSSSYLLTIPSLSYAGKTYFAGLSSTDVTRFSLSNVGNVVTQAPTAVSTAAVSSLSVGSKTFGSSSKLAITWTAPSGAAVNSYRVTAREAAGTGAVSATVSSTSATLTGLKAATRYALTVTACLDTACANQASSAVVYATTSEEYWQLQGTGNTTAGLTRIVSDGNVRISATRIGSDAGSSTADRIQLYYGPALQGNSKQALSTALTSSAVSAANPTSYLNFTSSGGTTGLLSPSTATTAVSVIATGQGVPLSAAMGGKIRLFFEAEGSDRKTRIYSLDSVDGYVGQDFNSGSTTLCSTATDYTSTCVPTLVVGVDGDAVGANKKIDNARQNKVGYATLSDWRWDGAAGTFMVFTSGAVTGCATGKNHGYAVWDGSAWNVQYAANGCPKLFTNVQAAFPLHIGGVKYKLYYGDPSITTGQLSSNLPFLGPKKLIYGDGSLTGLTDRVDFEDWEAQSTARDVIFLWPNGDQLDATAEGYIDDYHFLTPTSSLDLQVMYLAITNGTAVPLAAAAILLNP